MKKISVLVAALFAGAMMFVGAGCDQADDIKDLIAPSKTWCSTDVTYKKADADTASTALHVSFFYTDTAIAKSSSSDGYKRDIPAGLTILVTLKNGGTNNLITQLTNTTYIIKSFPKDEDTTGLEDGDTTTKFKGNFAAWGAIYRLKSDLQNDKSTSVPGALRNDTNYTELNWDEIKENFSWKRLLVNYLSQKL